MARFLPADVIVYATGYRPILEWVSQLISPDVARKVGPCWGLGSGTEGDPGPWEGELRNMWKPTAQEGLWFQGGNLMQSRFHSLHLALAAQGADGRRCLCRFIVRQVFDW